MSPAERHAALKRQVALCRAADMADDAIAEIMQIPVDQLIAAYPRELKFGREIVKAEELRRLDVASGNGSVPAAKALLAVTGNGDQPQGGRKVDDSAGKENNRSNVLALRLLSGGKLVD